MDEFRDVLATSVGHLYDLEQELKGGGMSHVWLARDKALGRAIVIKVLDPTIGAAVSVARFRREIELAASLQHPQIVPLLSAGEAGGLPYYTMPYIDGESLRRRLRRGEPMAPSQLIRVLGDVALALDHAHRNGIIHRDIKPENVLLVGRCAMVIDFGIAKALTQAIEESDPGLTRSGAVLGSPPYMSPEQISGDDVDFRADLYAWGVLAYEVLSGAHPFAHCRNSHDYLRAHLYEQPTPLNTRVPALSAALAALIARCLEKSPANRPSSAEEIVKVLDLLGGSTGDHPRFEPKKRNWTPVVTGAGALLAFVTAALFASRGGVSGADAREATKSIAVIPFVNVSGDSSQDYFADGMADGLSTEFGRVRGLRVASRTAAFRYKERRDLDVREVRRTLGVDAVVQGTVRRIGGRWRVSVQLMSGVTGDEIWSNVYFDSTSDVLIVQDQVSRAIVGALRVRPTNVALADTISSVVEDASRRSPPVLGTRNPVAYDLYLKGRFLFERRGPGVAKAVDYFSQALGEDSLFASAHASRALALLLVPFYIEGPLVPIVAQAETSAKRALALDPNLADAHLAIAGVHRLKWEWTAALDAFRVALNLDPRNVVARLNYAQLLYAFGDAEASLKQIEVAKTLDPKSPLILLGEARVMTLRGRQRDVVTLSERARRLDPTLPQTQVYRAFGYLRLGDPVRALAIIDSATIVPSVAAEAAYVIGATASRSRADAFVRRLRTQSLSGPFKHSAVAMAYLGMRDTLRALEEFEAAAAARELTPLNLSFLDPAYDPIRGSRRFAEIVRQYGLDERRFANPSAEISNRSPK